jgi:TolB-like protein/Tfp pilus assembly protein PilF
MDVLACLAGVPGRVVTKEELLAAVWGGAFVEEGALSQAIHSLRKALGDDARQPRYIQTIPKRGYQLLAPVMRERQVPRPLDEIRIVVLPFENLGKPEDPDFAAGLTEEITANLSLLPMVQVIPGRNVLGDKGVLKPLSEIWKKLGVDYVLRGQVSWPPDGWQVRVLTQLIRMADETLLPVTPFEGDAQSPLKAQQEISRAIFTTLGITLAPEQSWSLGKRSTENPEAYRAYVQGLLLKDQPFYRPPNPERAAQMFEQAVETDPAFAEAWAQLSQVHSYLACNTDRSSKRLEQARQAMEKAVALDPNLMATHLAQAYFSYRCLEDYDAAFEHLMAAARSIPYRVLADLECIVVEKARGRYLVGEEERAAPCSIYEKSLVVARTNLELRGTRRIEMLKKAAALNPRTAELVWAIAETYGALRDYARADAYFEQAISLAPDEPINYEQRALIRFAWTGNLNESRAILEDSPVRDSPQLQLASVYFDLCERKFQQALTRLSSENEQKLLSPADQTRLAALRVMALEGLGDHQRALALTEASLPVLKLHIAQYSSRPVFRVYLALALARLGRRVEALVLAKHAVPQSHDFPGPLVAEGQAMVAATLGRRSEAVALLSSLLNTPYRQPISVNELRLDPVWDPLRGYPEFEALLREREIRMRN